MFLKTDCVCFTGKVTITVRAGAVQSRELCGNEAVTLPDKGRVDAVMQSVIVEVRNCLELSENLDSLFYILLTC